MTTFGFTCHTDDPLGPTWTLSGLAGAIVFSPMGIDVHSPVPMYKGFEEPSRENCPVTHRACWHDGSSLSGRVLRTRWESAEFDNQIIRDELETWYDQFLAKAGTR